MNMLAWFGAAFTVLTTPLSAWALTPAELDNIQANLREAAKMVPPVISSDTPVWPYLATIVSSSIALAFLIGWLIRAFRKPKADGSVQCSIRKTGKLDADISFEIKAFPGKRFFYPPPELVGATGHIMGYISLFRNNILVQRDEAIRSTRSVLNKMSAVEVQALIDDGTITEEVTPASTGAASTAP